MAITECNELQTAISSAAAGEVITLGLNCTKEIVIPAGKNLTLDLAGYNLYSYAQSNVVMVEEGATFILTDSVGTGMLKAGSYPGYYALRNDGNARLENVTVWGDIQNNGTLTRSSLTFDPEEYGIYKIENYGTLNDLDAASESQNSESNNSENSNAENSGSETETKNTETPLDQTSTETDPALEPLGETYTVASQSQTQTAKTTTLAVPNTGEDLSSEAGLATAGLDLSLALVASFALLAWRVSRLHARRRI